MAADERPGRRVTGGSVPLVVFGAGGQARETAELAGERGWRVTAFVDLRPGPALGHVPVIVEAERPRDVPCVIGVGDPETRAKIFASAEAEWPTLVHPTAVLSPQATISGTAAIVQAASVVSCDVRVGNGVLVNYGATIGHDAVLGDFCVVLPGASVSGGVRVGAGAMVGSRAVVLPGVTIGRAAVVGAGAVVTKDVPDHCTVVGVPAAVIRRGGDA